MCQYTKRRVFGRHVRYLPATDNHVKQHQGQVSLLDGLDDQQQVNTYQSEQASAAGRHVIPLHGLEQYQVINQSRVDQRSSVSHKNSTGSGGRREGSVVSVQEKRERKRLIDAKYRYNKRVEKEKLKDEISILRNMLQASEQGKETEVPNIHGPLQDFVSDRDLPVVVEDEPPRILEGNQPLTYPQLIVQYNIQRGSSVVLSDESQRTLSDVVQNDARKFMEENQLLTQPQLFPACYLALMEKLERDERSTVSYSAFMTLLQGETQEVGGYRIPLVLHPIFEKIVTSYGDITSNSMLSSFSAENVFLQFLATIKEMGDTSFEQVTEELIFKWRDCIAEAKRIKFNVDFATEHLKKIAKSYLARKACNELSSIDERMEVLETELNDLKREKLEKLEMYSQLLAASEDFPGNVGLF